MTKLDVIKAHKRAYYELEVRIPEMDGLEKEVARHITLPWLKGKKWLGGLSDSDATVKYIFVSRMGYSIWDVEKEALRQMDRFGAKWWRD